MEKVAFNTMTASIQMEKNCSKFYIIQHKRACLQDCFFDEEMTAESRKFKLPNYGNKQLETLPTQLFKFN